MNYLPQGTKLYFVMKLIDPEEAKHALRTICDDYSCTLLSIDEI